MEYNDIIPKKVKSPIDGSENCFRVFTEPISDDHYLCMTTGYMSTSHFKVAIPFNDGLFVVLPGVSVHNGKKITAFASVTNVIKLVGYVEQHV